MVSFTCNCCGDSLKKKEVTTHFSRKNKCREAASLTCFDCLKEFGQNYESHTVCITEDQRYSSGGLAAVSKNKQQEWTALVHIHVKSILMAQKSSLSKSVVNALEFVCKNASVPKKEKPFFNFLRNARRFVEDDIRAAWKIVQEAQKQGDATKVENTEKNGPKNGDVNGVAPTTNGKAPSPKKNKSSEPMEGQEPSDESKPEVDGEQKKKKKKSKNLGLSGEFGEITLSEEVSTDMNESKQQKKKKEKSADTSQVSEEIPMEVEEPAAETEEKLSKKEKKMKKKQEKFEAEMKAVEAAKPEEDAEEVEEPAVEEGKKKKKSKKQALEAEENVETDKKSKKKRERTVSMAAETDQPKKKNRQKNNDENTEPNEVEEDVSSRKDFNWNSVIIQVLQSQDDKEMSVKRLCKKVVNEYLSSLLEGAHVDELKATAKFQKKLHKTPGVFVHKDKAKLKATDEN